MNLNFDQAARNLIQCRLRLRKYGQYHHRFHRGRFSCSIGSEKAEHVPLAERQRNTGNGVDASELLRQANKFQHRTGGRCGHCIAHSHKSGSSDPVQGWPVIDVCRTVKTTVFPVEYERIVRKLSSSRYQTPQGAGGADGSGMLDVLRRPTHVRWVAEGAVKRSKWGSFMAEH